MLVNFDDDVSKVLIATNSKSVVGKKLSLKDFLKCDFEEDLQSLGYCLNGINFRLDDIKKYVCLKQNVTLCDLNTLANFKPKYKDCIKSEKNLKRLIISKNSTRNIIILRLGKSLKIKSLFEFLDLNLKSKSKIAVIDCTDNHCGEFKNINFFSPCEMIDLCKIFCDLKRKSYQIVMLIGLENFFIQSDIATILKYDLKAYLLKQCQNLRTSIYLISSGANEYCHEDLSYFTHDVHDLTLCNDSLKPTILCEESKVIIR